MAKVRISHPDDQAAADALRLGVPASKCSPLRIHKGMEGERTGMAHLSSHSSRYMKAHDAMGTKIKHTEYGP